MAEMKLYREDIIEKGFVKILYREKGDSNYKETTIESSRLPYYRDRYGDVEVVDSSRDNSFLRKGRPVSR